MPRQIIPYANNTEHFAWWDGGFNIEELDSLQERAKNNTDAALVGTNLQNNPDVRRSEISWLEDNKENSWLFKKVGHITSCLNSDFFRFNLSCFAEQAQITNYSSENQGKYDWHLDNSTANQPFRKLSIVLQLTDPEDYEGGELQILVGQNPTVIEKKRGLLTVFPSNTLHRVTPVTQGSRQSLVLWITGEPFR